MEALILEEADDSPKVILDPDNNAFEISGKSLPEHVIGFYQPILDWLDLYAEASPTTTNFTPLFPGPDGTSAVIMPQELLPSRSKACSL